MTKLNQIKAEMTAREWEAFKLFARGYDSFEVAQAMGVAKSTARTYLQEIYAILGLTHLRNPNGKMIYKALAYLGLDPYAED
jgi:DNA-binding NarL/FixJ family response regulator